MMRLAIWLEERLGAWSWHLLWMFWRLFLFMLLLAIALFCTLLVVLETPLGTRLFLEDLLGLNSHFQIRWHAGSLDDHLVLDRIDWQARTFHLHAESIQVDSRISKLVQGQWPLSNLGIRVLELDYPYKKPHVTVLKRLWIPFVLDLSHGHIQTIRINRAGKVDAGYQLDLPHARWQGHQLVLQSATLQHIGIPGPLRLHLSGMVQLTGDYPLLATGWMGWPELEQKGMQPWRLDLAGSVVHLKVWTESPQGAVPVRIRGSIWSTQPHVPYDLKAQWHDVTWPWLPGAALQSSSGVMRAQGTLERYQMHASLHLTGRHVPEGNYELTGEGNWHQIQIGRILYQGLGGSAQGSANLAWKHDELQWNVDFDVRHVVLSRQWSYLSTTLPIWHGHWESTGQAQKQWSQWQVSGANGTELWHINGTVPAWISRLDQPYDIKVQASRLSRRLLSSVDVRIQQVDLDMIGPWNHYLWHGKVRIDVLQKGRVNEHAIDLALNGAGIQTDWQLNRLEWHSPHLHAQFNGAVSHHQNWALDGLLDFDKLILQPWWSNAPQQLTGHTQVALQHQGKTQILAMSDVQAQGQHGDHPIVLRMERLLMPLSSREHHFSISGLNFSSSPDGWLSADGVWDSSPHISLRAAHWPLGILLAQAQGELDGTLMVQGRAEHPDVRADLQLSQTHLGPWSVATGHVVMNLVQLGAQDSHVVLSLQTINHNDHDLGDLLFQLQGRQQAHDWHIDWHLGSDFVINAQGQGGWKPEDGSYNGLIRQSLLQLDGVHWNDDLPVALTLHPASISAMVAPTCWHHAQARFCLDEATTLQQSRSIRISLHQLTAADVSPWLPDGLSWQGNVHGQADLLWGSGKNPVSHLDVQSEQGTLLLGQDQSEPLRFPYEDVRLHAALGQGQFTTLMNLHAAGKGSLQAQASINLQSHLLQGALDIQKLNVQTFQGFFPQLSELKGVLDAHAVVSGSMHQPQVQGAFAVNQGEILSRDHAIHLHDIMVQGQLTPELWSGQATFKTTHGQGKLTDQTIWSQGQWNSRVNLDVSGLSLDRLPLLSSSIDAHLRALLMPYTAHIEGLLAFRSVSKNQITRDVVLGKLIIRN